MMGRMIVVTEFVGADSVVERPISNHSVQHHSAEIPW